ncbi:hypothetical protein CPB83DRAFT_298313 [Crepidotus variabilis]|uniref:Uncharacterized protein n=1 Tax=Crepidotus variabilis TaxID=179855 RepID=A0A9P6JQ27_9AGAR|nr:hypothetical protein CPB83DRAFT_298313 [Crepidotus variabilis]
MSRVSQRSMNTAAATLLTPRANTSSVSSVPIAQLVPYITTTLGALGTILTFSLSLFRPLLVLWPLPILLYIFAPVTFFLDLATTLFIRLPYWSLAYILDAVYPLYVLLGVACITGGLIGIGGRALCHILITSLALPTDVERITPPVKDAEEQKLIAKGKGKRTERVKFEQT